MSPEMRRLLVEAGRAFGEEWAGDDGERSDEDIARAYAGLLAENMTGVFAIVGLETEGLVAFTRAALAAFAASVIEQRLGIPLDLAEVGL